MKKIILSVSFIIIALSVAIPAFADTTFWDYSGIPNVKGSTMKAAATLSYDIPGQGPQKPVKYYPTYVVFHLTKDVNGVAGVVETDFSISGTTDPTGGGAFNVSAGMHGAALLVAGAYNISASYNPLSDIAHPFSFADGINSMTDAEFMTTTAEGTLAEILKKGVDQYKAGVSMTFKIVGKLDNTNYPALITVTLAGTVPEIP